MKTLLTYLGGASLSVLAVALVPLAIVLVVVWTRRADSNTARARMLFTVAMLRTPDSVAALGSALGYQDDA